MNFAALHDGLEVINGPEDGTFFPLVRTPAEIGSDARCTVAAGTDPAVLPLHARLTPVADGYRVRKLRGGLVRVNGRSVGRIRSRIVNNGGIIQAGNSLFTLACAPDGLAGRSRGLPTDSDAVWAAREILGRIAGVLWLLFRMVRRLFRSVLSTIITVLVILALLSVISPELRARFQQWFYLVRLQLWNWGLF